MVPDEQPTSSSLLPHLVTTAASNDGQSASLSAPMVTTAHTDISIISPLPTWAQEIDF
jgi:hypothetical protein